MPKKSHFLDQLDWSRAFDMFMAAYLEKHPECVQCLLSYAHRIKGFMKQGINWYNYDVSFRKEVEIDSERGLTPDWGDLKMDLYFTASKTPKPYSATPIALAASPKRAYRDGIAKTNEGGLPNGICFRYHSRERRCESPTCPWSHNCHKGGGKHGLLPRTARGKRKMDEVPRRASKLPQLRSCTNPHTAPPCSLPRFGTRS